MATELVTHTGIAWDGSTVEHDQWFVTVDGINLGLLCKKPDSAIMLLIEGNKLSAEAWIPLVAECASLAGHAVNPPVHFYVPPAEELADDDDEEEEDEEENDS